MQNFKLTLSVFSLILFASIANAEPMSFKGICTLNQTSPDHTLAGREIVNGRADVVLRDDVFTASFIDYDGEKKQIKSPKLSIRLNDGVMALSGMQWIAKNNRTYYVITNSLKMSFDKCTQ